MGIEQKVNYQLNKFPIVKKGIKRFYQRVMYAVSSKIKSEGNIIRISPNDPNYEYFFGYYDKSPWDATDRYMLCLRARDTWSDVSPKEVADILIIDTEKSEMNPERTRKVAETHAWNVQQSCMLQWLGPDFSKRILYNDCRDGQYCSIILDLETLEEKVISAAVYSVASDGKTALTLDFSRLYNLRPGYGYYNVPEKTEGIGLPDTTAVWRVDLETGGVTDLLKYTDFASFHPRPEMLEVGAVHKVNHIMLSPNGKRFMVLYRWFNGQRKYTRLITCNTDGSDMYVLSDDDMVSHCCWKNNSAILAFENKKKTGPGYYLMKDKTRKYMRCWPQLFNDGHPSYSSDRKLVVTDSYPNKARVASINLMDGDEGKRGSITIAKVFSPFKYDNDTRCDLHPRWNHTGNKVCFDSVFEGHRGVYVVQVDDIIKKKDFLTQIEERKNTINVMRENKEDVCITGIAKTNDRDNRASKVRFSIITPVYNSYHLMKRYFNCLSNQTYRNFEVILVDDCSTDDSYERLVQYQKKSSLDLTVLQTEENSGPGHARNIGMTFARGEWITFIDNDDWVTTTFLERINCVIDEQNPDCVIYDYYIQFKDKEKKVAKSIIGESGGPVSTIKCVMNVTNHTFGKFYKFTNCVGNNIKFPCTRRCEDIAFTTVAVSACKNIFYLDEPMYYYYQRGNSLSNNSFLGEKDLIRTFGILQKKLEKNYPEEVKERSVRDLLYSGVLLMCKSKRSRRKIKRFISEYEYKYPDWYKCEMVHMIGKAKQIFLVCIRHRMIMALRLMSYVHTKIIEG